MLFSTRAQQRSPKTDIWADFARRSFTVALAVAFLFGMIPAAGCRYVDRATTGPDRWHYGSYAKRHPLYVRSSSNCAFISTISFPLADYLPEGATTDNLIAYDTDNECELPLQFEDSDGDGVITRTDNASAIIRVSPRRWQRVWLYCKPKTEIKPRQKPPEWTVAGEGDFVTVRGTDVSGREIVIELSPAEFLPRGISVAGRKTNMVTEWPAWSAAKSDSVKWRAGPVRAEMVSAGKHGNRRLSVDSLGRLTFDLGLASSPADPKKDLILKAGTAWTGEEIPVFASGGAWRFFENAAHLKGAIEKLDKSLLRFPNAPDDACAICRANGGAGGVIARESGVGFCIAQRFPGADAALLTRGSEISFQADMAESAGREGEYACEFGFDWGKGANAGFVMQVLTREDAKDAQRMVSALDGLFCNLDVINEASLTAILATEAGSYSELGLPENGANDVLIRARATSDRDADALKRLENRIADLYAEADSLSLSGLANAGARIRLRNAANFISAARRDNEFDNHGAFLTRLLKARDETAVAESLMKRARDIGVGKLIMRDDLPPTTVFGAVMSTPMPGLNASGRENPDFYSVLTSLGINAIMPQSPAGTGSLSTDALRNDMRFDRLFSVWKQNDMKVLLPIASGNPESYFRELYKLYGADPETIAGWLGPDLPCGDPRTFVTDPKEKTGFRQWLTARYGSLDALNKRWKTSFPDWSKVEAPNPKPGADTQKAWTVPDEIDWATADMLEYGLSEHRRRLAGSLAWMSEDTHSRPIMWPQALTVLNSRESLLSQCSDGFIMAEASRKACSLKVPLCARPDAFQSIAQMGFASEGEKALWVTDFCLPGVANPILPPDPDLLRRFIWAALAYDVRGFFCRNWEPLSWLNIDGTFTDAAIAFANARAEAGELAQPLRLHRNILVGVLYSRACATRDQLDPNGRAVASCLKALLDADVPASTVDAEAVLAGGLSKYEVLLIPATPYIEKGLKPKIEEFVANGGVLIAECPIAVYDLDGKPQETVPGDGLAEIFGARCLTNGRPLAPPPAGSNEFSILECNGAVPLELATGNFSVSLTDPTWASWRKIKNGTAVLLGRRAQEDIAKSLQAAGWKPPVRVEEAQPKQTETLLLGGDLVDYMVILNHGTARKVTVRIDDLRVRALGDKVFDVFSLDGYDVVREKDGWLRLDIRLKDYDILLIPLH
ncbi:MAG TPA: beta-galactosidase trimerization domain-containing protein [Candidatus Brocadiia bacterium]|nr:beta-galactosidase trimerization domain-containing protein [Candidatus Brocadiia bacterium]